jgi:hypothetical protein
MRIRWDDNINSHFICLRIGSVVGCYEHDLQGSIEAGNFFSESMSVRALYCMLVTGVTNPSGVWISHQ